MAVTVKKKGVFTGTAGDDSILVKGDSIVVNANSGNDTISLKGGTRMLFMLTAGMTLLPFLQVLEPGTGWKAEAGRIP